MWLAPKLKHRVEIQEPVQTGNLSGGFDRSYTTLVTIWAGIKEDTDLVSSVRGMYIRGTQTIDEGTHEFTVRRAAVYYSLNNAFNKEFSNAFDNINDLNPLKSDNFIFLQANSGSSTSGRRFKIIRTRVDDSNKEFVKIRVKEIEEIGTGWPE